MVRGKRKATKNDLVSYEVIQMASMGDALAMEQVLILLLEPMEQSIN